MKNNKINIYFIPGMAASSSIFDSITLPADRFNIHLLEWLIPHKKESLSGYAKRMAAHVTHENPVLLGVSFGGMVAQEMARHINVSRLIIISSVKSRHELPWRMRVARYTKVYKLLPTGMANNIELLLKYAYGGGLTKRLERYQKYIAIRDKQYLDWAIAQVVNWKQEKPLENSIHIHGDRDTVFPIKNIKDCIPVKGGTHIMILQKYKWFNKNLPAILLN